MKRYNILSENNSPTGEKICKINRSRKRHLFGAALALFLTAQSYGQDHMVTFDTEAEGEYKGLDLWGLDTAWLWDANVIRGVNFMGKPQTDLIRFSFTGDTPIVDGELTGEGLEEFNFRMSIVDTYTKPETMLYLNNDTENWNSNPYLAGGGVNPYLWAELIAVTAEKAKEAGREVITVAPFNEPDHGTWQGNVSRFGDVVWQLRWSGSFPAFSYSVPDGEFINIMGGNTLNNDNAAAWYNQLNDWGFVEEGNTHQLAGSFDNYAAFYQSIEANGDVGTNDELHNVVEAMVGAEYGMDVGIWWGTAERARGEFVKASDGMRLAYAEDRPNWTAASVYRAPDGKVQAFVGESERQARPTTYRFFSKDRPVFYDGYGPQRAFDVTTTGSAAYWTSDHHNAERVVNITWGEDIQPVIDGRYYLVNRESLRVMEIDGASLDNWANVGENAFDGTANQEWDVVPVPRTIGGDYSYFSVRNVNSGKASNVNDWSLVSGGNISQVEIDGNPNVFQQWFLEYVEDGWFRLGSRWSGLFLAADGSNIVQQSEDNEYAQQWRLVPVGADPTDVTAPSKPRFVRARANAASVEIFWRKNWESDLASYTVLRAMTANGPYETIARGLTSTSYTDNTANQNVPYYYVVRAVDQSLNRSQTSRETSATPTGDPALVAQYAFRCDVADDSSNANDGILEGSGRYVAGGDSGSCLVLDGGYANLPAGVASHDSITIAAWVNWFGGNNWQRIFDFGNGTEEYLFLTPSNWDGNTMQFTITDDGETTELYAPAPPLGQWTHVAVTIGDGTAALYVDGVLAGAQSTNLRVSDFNPVLNYIGKSQYSDPPFNGAIDDFCIYNYALAESEIAELADVVLLPPAARKRIDFENPDFEAGIANFSDGFDADPDIPGWIDYNISDAGVEGGSAWWGTYNGSFSAFFAPGNSAYLLSEYSIQEGDEFDLGYVAKSWSGGASEWTVTLFYDSPSNVIGTYTAPTTGEWLEYASQISATSESIGGTLGILFTNTGSQFANLDEVSVTIGEDVPAVFLTATPSILVRPDHKMRDVEMTLEVCDCCAAPEDLTVTCFVSSNEADDGLGDGRTTGDVNGSDGYASPVQVNLAFDGTNYVGTVQLRAERSGLGSGRFYTIVCDVATDSGAATTTSFEIEVPMRGREYSDWCDQWIGKDRHDLIKSFIQSVFACAKEESRNWIFSRKD